MSGSTVVADSALKILTACIHLAQRLYGRVAGSSGSLPEISVLFSWSVHNDPLQSFSSYCIIE